MTETGQIVDQLRRMYDGPAWHGPALKEVLQDITAEQARKRPLQGVHSIEELVAHMTAWIRIARERLSAETIRDHTDEEVWSTTLRTWEMTLQSLEREQRGLENEVRKMPPERLTEVAPASEPQTFYVLLHGVVQHNAYHTGQIVLLKKFC